MTRARAARNLAVAMGRDTPRTEADLTALLELAALRLRDTPGVAIEVAHDDGTHFSRPLGGPTMIVVPTVKVTVTVPRRDLVATIVADNVRFTPDAARPEPGTAAVRVYGQDVPQKHDDGLRTASTPS
jgi:hypothetical protein